MASSNICWGIEPGAGAIKAVKLELTGERVKLLDFAYVPHAKTLSTPGLDQDDAMRVALGTLASQYDLSGARVAVSVPGHSAFARFAKLPPVEPKKVPQIVKFEAVQQIPFPLEEVEWDYQTFQSPDSPDVEVGIFAITKERVNRQLQMLADVQIVPDVVMLSPVAVYNALAFDLEFTEKTPGTIILDIGTTSSDLVIADAGRVWVRTFPLGGHHFTDALVSAFKLGYPKAERLKREAEQGAHAKHVFQAMRGVFTELVQEIQRSMGYYQSLHRDAKLSRLIGLGATFELPGLRKYLKQQLDIDVYRLEEFKRLDIDADRKAQFAPLALQMTTAYGLAVQGVGMQTIDANLIPVERVREAMWRRKTPWFGLAAGVAAVAGGAMFYRPITENSKTRGVSPPSIIATAVRSANEARRDPAFDVVEKATSDLTAANLIAIGQNKPYFGHILHDLAAMIRDADGVRMPAGEPAVASPAFTLVSMRTTFVPPNVSAMQLRQTVRRSAFDQGRSGDDDPFAMPPQEVGIDKPRLAINVVLSTTYGDPRKLAYAALMPWLKQHSKRQGVPYVIVFDETGEQFLDIEEAPKEIASAADSSGAQLPAGLTDEEEQRWTEQYHAERVRRGEVTGTGSAAAPATGMTSGDLDALAPLEPGPDQAAPARQAKVYIFWYVVLDGLDEQSDSDEGGAS
ncbi:MAG: type IV pilus assembly protein PilM [Phycisphaeraceae bacterium]|nr:type IV pilus assembly protein PilM [Phycisphaeraceae bacterium]MCW5754278.1 type IV pilus assembly protein PilM [Phycisphaeraceae bacterium]